MYKLVYINVPLDETHLKCRQSVAASQQDHYQRRCTCPLRGYVVSVSPAPRRCYPEPENKVPVKPKTKNQKKQHRAGAELK